MAVTNQTILRALESLEKRLEKKFENIDQRFDQIDQRFLQIDERFVQMDERFGQIDERFGQMDERFGQMDERFGQMDERFGQMDERSESFQRTLDSLESKFEDLTVMVVNHDHRMKDFLTRHEFNVFKEENAAAHDRTAKAIDKLLQEMKAFNSAHNRLEERVNCHEKVLVRKGLMNASR